MSHWETAGHSDEWYTPKYIFDALGVTFDLDVAAPKGGAPWVPARWCICEDSLTKQWAGFVWMNPPFGKRGALGPWLDKFANHGNGIALVPDRTSAPWFQKVWPVMDAALFLPKVKFIRPDGSLGKSPSNGTALLAVGPTGSAALMCAQMNGLGILAAPK